MVAKVIILGLVNVILMGTLTVLMVLRIKYFKKKLELDNEIYKEYEKGFKDGVKELNDKLFQFYRDGFMSGYEEGCKGEKYWFDEVV